MIFLINVGKFILIFFYDKVMNEIERIYFNIVKIIYFKVIGNILSMEEIFNFIKYRLI